MNAMAKTGLVCLALLLPAFAAARDSLDDAKARLKIEAERAEREFTDLRAAAYRAVRSESPRLADALDKLEEIERLLKADTALGASKKASLLSTLKYDLSRVREIAGERSRTAERRSPPAIAREERRPASASYAEERRDRGKRAASIIDERKKMLADARTYRADTAKGRLGVYKSVDDSSVPQSVAVKFPRNWKELSERRSGKAKMTAKEKAIMSSLNKVVKVDFDKTNFQDALDVLRKISGLPISVDKRAMEAAGVTYDSPITLRNETSARSVLKRICGDLDLTYVIKDETVLITSPARANSMTVLKTYYLGDLAGVADPRLDPITSQLVMLERVNGIVSMITNSVDRSSWTINNPEASGKIAFYPATMTLIVRQSAEFHFRYFSGSR